MSNREEFDVLLQDTENGLERTSQAIKDSQNFRAVSILTNTIDALLRAVIELGTRVERSEEKLLLLGKELEEGARELSMKNRPKTRRTR